MKRSSATKSPWLAYSEPHPHAMLRVFCLPFAGGGASVYRTWMRRFPSEVDVCAVQIPGRETRLKEPPYHSVDPLAKALAAGLAPFFNLPFVIFGHSMGALIGFELCRELRRQGRPLPLHLFASGCRAPQVPMSGTPRHSLSDDEFMEELRHLSGTPEAVLQNAELMRFLLPTLRADFAIHDTYAYTPEPPLDCSLSAFGGQQDPDVTLPDLEAWQEQTAGDFSLRMFPGNHFFLQSDQDLLLDTVNHEILRLLIKLKGGLGK